MSQNLMEQLVNYEGECCIYGYFLSRKDMPTREIAEHLGITANAVRVWRRKIAKEDIFCGYGASGKGECLYREPENMPSGRMA